MALLINNFLKALWIIDSIFRWTPFGFVGQVHGDTFVREGKAGRWRQEENLKRHLKRVFWDRDRRWIIVFPEGTVATVF